MTVADQQSMPVALVKVPRREGYEIRVGLHEPDEFVPMPYCDLRLWSVWAPARQNWNHQAAGKPTRKGVTIGVHQLVAVRAALDCMIEEAVSRGMLTADEVAS